MVKVKRLCYCINSHRAKLYNTMQKYIRITDKGRRWQGKDGVWPARVDLVRVSVRKKSTQLSVKCYLYITE